ncbi:amidohydrolase [Angustibacter sp. McL0619]|uniref:amidohydrolase n=1 Tax=Angustibacter sp. McL0619 TaxID=3415676 RepID=UPI003CF4381A
MTDSLLGNRSGLADTLVVGAAVRTLDPSRPTATAVAIRDGVIAALDEEALDLRGSRTSVIDLAGATLTPGLVDGHTHPILGAELFVGTDLSSCKDLDDVRRVLAAAVVDLEPGEWLRGVGLNHNVFGGAPITNAPIDDVLEGIPALLRLYDGHSALASSAALRAAGVHGRREFAVRSEVVCDAAGHPTGYLLEHAAIDLVADVMPTASLAERRDSAISILAEMARSGLTGGHVMDGYPATLDLLADIEADGDLPMRLRLAPGCWPGEDLEALVQQQRRHGRRWAARAVKLFIDGTVEGGTAWLRRPDCHGQSTDSLWLDPAEYTKSVQYLAAAGVQTATHALGDAGVRHVIDALEDVDTHGVRHRIEHLETLPLEDIRRLVRAGLVASMQPSHSAYTTADHVDEWSRRLGEERANRGWCCRDVRDAGGILVLGSDWPVADYDARDVLTYARLRRPAGTDKQPFLPEQGLTGLMALEGMTTHAALAAGEESVAGRIVPGMRADLTAFAIDPVTAPADEVAEAPIRLTMVDGTVTHQA